MNICTKNRSFNIQSPLSALTNSITISKRHRKLCYSQVRSQHFTMGGTEAARVHLLTFFSRHPQNLSSQNTSVRENSVTLKPVFPIKKSSNPLNRRLGGLAPNPLATPLVTVASWGIQCRNKFASSKGCNILMPLQFTTRICHT